MKLSSKIIRFEDLIVWQKSMSLTEEIYRASREGEFAKDWGLKNQIQRAAVSIPSNIAEGFERYSNKEFRKFLLIAKGSAGELRTHLYLARSIGYLVPMEGELLVEKCFEVSRLLGGTIRSVTEKQ
jgi:four helix bundle protein